MNFEFEYKGTYQLLDRHAHALPPPQLEVAVEPQLDEIEYQIQAEIESHVGVENGTAEASSPSPPLLLSPPPIAPWIIAPPSPGCPHIEADSLVEVEVDVEAGGGVGGERE